MVGCLGSVCVKWWIILQAFVVNRVLLCECWVKQWNDLQAFVVNRILLCKCWVKQWRVICKNLW